MKISAPPLVALAILFYCAWNSFHILSDWFGDDPLAHFAWLAFVIWIFPLILYWTPGSFLGASRAPCNAFLLALALATSFLGMIGSLNVLQYFGLALALGGVLPWSWNLAIWIVCSVSWMPALAWLASHTFPAYIVAMRLLLASASAVWLIIALWRNKKDYTQRSGI